MKRETQQVSRRHQGYLPGFMVTIMWLIPTMLVTAMAGFFLARDVFSPKYLQPSKVQSDKPHPIRILSPEEAARLSKDKDSKVWTEGVKESDIPKMRTEALYSDDEASPRKTRHTNTKKKTADHQRTVKKSEPSTVDQPDNTGDALTPPNNSDAPDSPETTPAPAEDNSAPLD